MSIAKEKVFIRSIALAFIAIGISSCVAPDMQHQILISAREQKMAVLDQGNLLAVYPVSTSKFCLGDRPGSYGTPLGQLEVADKIGDGAPIGTVFKDRHRTGEVIPINAPGRDPIVTRIIWLRGLEVQNANAYARDIYIHGTPEERNIGHRASYGCIRMRSADIVNLYNIVGPGAKVTIVDASLDTFVPQLQPKPKLATIH
jgi:hypothetical protein